MAGADTEALAQTRVWAEAKVGAWAEEKVAGRVGASGKRSV